MTGLRFRRGAPRGEVSVSNRAQGFSQLFTRGLISLERQAPSLIGVLLLVRQPVPPAPQKFTDFGGIVQGELGSRRTPPVLVVPHDNPDSVGADRFEGVFVGEV